MPKLKVIHDRDICIGCGACAMICPKNWEMNSDGKADLKKGDSKKEVKHVGGPDDTYELEIKPEDKEKNEEAANNCPVLCIHVKEE